MITSREALQVAALLEKTAAEAPDIEVTDLDRAAGTVVAWEALKSLVKQSQMPGGMTGATAPVGVGMNMSSGGAPAVPSTPPAVPMSQPRAAPMGRTGSVQASPAVRAPLSTNASSQLSKMSGADPVGLGKVAGPFAKIWPSIGRAFGAEAKEGIPGIFSNVAKEVAEEAATKAPAAAEAATAATAAAAKKVGPTVEEAQKVIAEHQAAAQRSAAESVEALGKATGKKHKLVEEGAEEAAGWTPTQKAVAGLGGGAGGAYMISRPSEPQVRVQSFGRTAAFDAHHGREIFAETMGFIEGLGLEKDAAGFRDAMQVLWSGVKRVAGAPGKWRAARQAEQTAAETAARRSSRRAASEQRRLERAAASPAGVGGLRTSEEQLGKLREAAKPPAAPSAAPTAAPSVPPTAPPAAAEKGLWEQYKELPTAAQIGIPAGGSFLIGAGYGGGGRPTTVQKF